MQCPSCGTINPTQARFCMGCGRLLVAGVVCGNCHTLLPVQARYCYHCGTFQAQPSAAGVQWTVDVSAPQQSYVPPQPIAPARAMRSSIVSSGPTATFAGYSNAPSRLSTVPSHPTSWPASAPTSRIGRRARACCVRWSKEPLPPPARSSSRRS